MICGKCGAAVADKNRFCPECGAKLDVPPQSPPQWQIHPAQRQGQPAPTGQPAGEPPRKKKSPAIPVAIVCAVIVVAVICLLIVFFKNAGGTPDDGSPQTTAAADTTAATEKTDGGSTTQPQPDSPNADESALYRPGSYVQNSLGGILLYTAPDSADLVDDGITVDGRAMLTVTEVKKNKNAEGAYDLWRGKTSVNGFSGWINLYEYTCTDLKETDLTAAQESAVLEKLKGVWTAETEDCVVFFTPIENEGTQLKIGPRASEPDFYGMLYSPMQGEANGLVRLTAAQASGDYDGVSRTDAEICLYVDLSKTDNGKLVWSFDKEDWTVCFFVTEDPEEFYALPSY